ncbi:hypothetical protein [Listeria seeligeri]|uniref:hypothetical protein n=1 Tax=Listeria seeligeri TaxID=1640 RepID=UPI0010BA3867|nr:hypothetical protein [Listeria seeligeri]EAC2922397.1 hypothetical protein [Listeria monocytogenes]MBC1556999.1 hypothetical protein [Listeria seeligeri]HAB0718281.1 hypothetical protein [Listeria monocytogenes]
MAFKRDETIKSKTSRVKAENPLLNTTKNKFENMRVRDDIKYKIEVLKDMRVSNKDGKEFTYDTLNTLADYFVKNALTEEQKKDFAMRLSMKG